ncbi:MAG: bacterial transcriptional activator domain-containing protein [Coriobacteriia bacterium]|nr:bacterial transcriptional activator domain-containing protein [Coriobacteriia bacterium]
MSIATISKDMSDLISRFIDSLSIDEKKAKACLRDHKDLDLATVKSSDDPFVLMTYASLFYGCQRYTESLACLRRATELFERKDNPLHFDTLCVLEVMNLRVLSRIPQALGRARRHLRNCEGASRKKLCIISVDLYRVQGLYEEAHVFLEGLIGQETDDDHRERLLLLRELVERDRTQDHQAFCQQISSPYWHYLNEASHDLDTKDLLHQYGSELAYSYAFQGRIDLAAAVLRDLDGHKVANARIPVLSAQALCFGATQKFDEALDRLRNEEIHTLGISLEDAFNAYVARLIILHFAGHKREAVPLSVKLSEFARCNPTLSISPIAHLLHVSVMLWMYDFAQAELLLDQFMPETEYDTLRVNERALHACLRALIAYRSEDLAAGQRIIREARHTISDPNASMLIAALCVTHSSLLGLIASALGVDVIPGNLVELVDHTRYHKQILRSCEILSKEQGKRLQNRLTRVDTGLRIDYEEQTKPIVINLFGGLDVSRRGEMIDLSGWTRSKSHQLFLRAVLEQGADLPRETTLSLLWPDLTKISAANNYYVTLSKMYGFLEEKFGQDEAFEVISRATCGKIHLNLVSCESDIGHFDNAILHARKCVLEKDHLAALQYYYRLVELYRGDLLVGEYDYRWLDIYRDRYRKRYLDSMVAASNLCLEVGEPGETHFFVDAGLRHNPSREAFYELSIKAYKAMGRREDALNIYYECVDYLQETLGLDPGEHFQDLFNDLLSA